MRVRSIDVFRGVTLAAMVIVNNPGDWGNVYAPLLHAEWHGVTPTDLIFPCFLFVVGVAITFAGAKRSSWTSSYVLFTGGAAALALAACSWWSDGATRGGRFVSSEPFVALGRNALLLFVVSGLGARLLGIVRVGGEPAMTLKAWIYSSAFSSWASPKNASLLFALANLGVLFALLWSLHRRRTYWTV